jgi:hypothetical protein
MVFKPTWSTCRCAEDTVDGQPRVARLLEIAQGRSWFQFRFGRVLSLPMQVSTMRCPCDSTTKTWMLMRSLPVSSAKVG